MFKTPPPSSLSSEVNTQDDRIVKVITSESSPIASSTSQPSKFQGDKTSEQIEKTEKLVSPNFIPQPYITDQT